MARRGKRRRRTHIGIGVLFVAGLAIAGAVGFAGRSSPHTSAHAVGRPAVPEPPVVLPTVVTTPGPTPPAAAVATPAASGPTTPPSAAPTVTQPATLSPATTAALAPAATIAVRATVPPPTASVLTARCRDGATRTGPLERLCGGDGGIRYTL